ncbi:MAG: GrpB family protein [Anaerolineae bacterium]|nr:GrpB family protein [Anaerolineae bacterium]
MIGLERGVVRLVPYTTEWVQLFEVEKIALQQVVEGYILDIQHVGSTAIPGMLAKPIIDNAIAVTDFEQARVCIPLIDGLGYDYSGEQSIPRRHMFAKGNPRTFHVHILEKKSLEWQNHLLFRDYLCQHPDATREYA